MKIFPAILFFLLFSVHAFSQIDTTRTVKADSGWIQDPRMNELLLKHIQINEAKRGRTDGYRVQIHFGQEKAKALEVKSKFTSENNEAPAYFDYQQPYFKVRVGDFRTKLEAYKFLQEIQNDFPGSFIVHDLIELPPL